MDATDHRFDINQLPEFGTPIALPGISAQAEVGGIASSDAATIVAILVYGISDA